MIKAIIFDMDGVIADTQKTHAIIESEILNRFGIGISPEEVTNKYAGVETAVFFKELLEEKNADIESLLQEKWERMFQRINNSITEIPGAIDLIEKCKSAGFKMAVASASSLEFVKATLTALNIINKFDVIISSEEVSRGKPAPDIFLLAAKRLEITPEDCVVIEDGVSGMQGAKAAGMKCIGLTNNRQAPTDIIISNFSEINVETIKNL